MASMDNVVLHWQIPEQGRHGEGISRPREGAKTRPYTLLVRLLGYQPMTVTLPAPDRRSALRFARNRWPNGVVEVPA